MLIALESNTSDRIERSGFVHGMSRVSIYDAPESSRPVSGIFSGDRRFPPGNMARNLVQEREEELDSSSSSSIGRNSDLSGGSSDGADGSGEGEVQSSYKGPLDTMEALEEVLPVKRGISKFYCGKSKSFTSLADASCSSIKDIAKPENAYTRKHKNLIACNNTFWDKNRNFCLRSSSGGISKRPANSSRSTLALAVTMSSSESNNNNENSNSNSNSTSPPPTLCLPPLYPHGRRLSNNESLPSLPQPNFSPWRSFSLSDLQCAAAATPSITGLVVGNGDDDDKLH